MKLHRHLTSLVTTVMVLDMLVVALAFLPFPYSGHTTVNAGTPKTTQTVEAGLFGCIWSCLKCVGTAGKNGKACGRCARCLGVDDEDDAPTRSGS